MIILGVHCGHDSSAAIVVDGVIIADVAEERFTRIKNDTSFPINAINYCLNKAKINSKEIDVLSVPSNILNFRFEKFFDIPKNIMPKSKTIKKLLGDFYSSFKSEKITIPKYYKPFELSKKCRVELVEHHLSHISCSAYTSGIALNEKVLGFSFDGRGDNTSVSIWEIQNNKIKNLKKYDGTGSLGWFYGNCTEAMDWRHGSEEWKVMGLAPYGKPQPGALKGYYPEYKEGKLVKSCDYGEFGIWNDHGSNHFHGKHSTELGEIYKSMKPEDFAAEVQRVSEEQAFNIIIPWVKKTGINKIVCSGGFFLNVKLNQKLWYTNLLDEQWVYPNPGDAGLAVGSALYIYFKENQKKQHSKLDNLYTGPEFSNDEIKKILDDRQIKYEFHENIEKVTAQYLSKNYVIGWFQGRMEAGPRALGNRSIVMSPIDPKNKDIINMKVKYREKFRPFCPSIKDENYNDYLKDARDELFMVTSFEAKENIKSRIPAVIHEDNSARPQKVLESVNKRYYDLIDEFGKITNEYVVLNTSFNIKGEPIVCNPREAIKCFYDTGLDCLVMGNYLVKKDNVTI